VDNKENNIERDYLEGKIEYGKEEFPENNQDSEGAKVNERENSVNEDI